MMRANEQLRKNEAGYVLITTALALATLLGFLGFLVDVGFLYMHKREAQIAADSAAQEAVLQMANGATSANAITYAKSDAGLNGFTTGTNGVTVTINIPPSSGNYSGDTAAAEAIVQQTVPTTLLKLLNINSGSVKARGVAVRGGTGGCMYALDKTASNAFVASGSANVNANCGLYVNSSNSKALSLSGSACISSPTVISIVGNYSNSSSCTLSVTPKTGQKSSSDPLAYVSAPTVPSGCNNTNYTLSGGSATISPGTYCGGITVSSNGTTLYLNQGLYILKGGGLTVSGGASMISNTGGVTFYNTQATGYSYKPITISGSSTITLQAPTSSSNGGIYGILFFQDRSISSSSQNTISGGSTTNLTGALYFPTTPLVYSGGSTGAGEWTAIVADTVTFSGNASLGKDFSSYPDGSPLLGNNSSFGE